MAVEEIHEARTQAPKAIVMSVGLGCVTGFVFLIAACFCIDDIAKVASTATGVPVVQIFYDSTQSVAGASCLAVLISVINIGAANGLTAEGGRAVVSSIIHQSPPKFILTDVLVVCFCSRPRPPLLVPPEQNPRREESACVWYLPCRPRSSGFERHILRHRDRLQHCRLHLNRRLLYVCPNPLPICLIHITDHLKRHLVPPPPPRPPNISPLRQEHNTHWPLVSRSLEPSHQRDRSHLPRVHERHVQLPVSGSGGS